MVDDLYDQAKIIDDNQNAIDLELSCGRRIFLASANTAWPIGNEVLELGQNLPDNNPPLPRRWISLPAELNRALEEQSQKTHSIDVVHDTKRRHHPAHPWQREDPLDNPTHCATLN